MESEKIEEVYSEILQITVKKAYEIGVGLRNLETRNKMLGV